MSARRLAIRQPESFKLSKNAIAEIDMWVAKYPDGRQRSALIPALWIAQKDAGGWLPELALRAVGDKLGMAYIRVYEVATFYTMFALEPVGTHFVQMCGTTPCWLRGSDELKGMLARKIGPQKTLSADGKLSWLEVECLGSCSNAPMVQISNAEGDHYYEDLTAESLETILDAFVAGETPTPGPQNSRHTSEPEGGAMALTTDGLSKARSKLVKLPNADKKAKVNYYEWDPKSRRATKGGWVDPKLKADADPKKRPANEGKDMTEGLEDKALFAARPKRARKAPVKKAEPKKPETKKVEAKKVKAKKEKPKVIYTDGPTDGAPDDLKKVKGIGPKFEGDLNSKGIYYFRQIAAWKVADVKMVEDLIDSIPGRIKRDEWVKQAKVLAKGGAPRKMKKAKA